LALLNHPHIVRLWDFVDNPAYPHLVLEHVGGPSLADLIRHSGRLSPERAVQIIAQIAEGVGAAAKIGVVHRDVKPGNILLHRDGKAKLVDFGQALVIGGEVAALARGVAPPLAGPVGTPAYMPPEQCWGAVTIDHRADIYALGATLYHAVTGRLPFSGRTRREVVFKQARQHPVAPHEVVPGLSRTLSAVILTMMAKDPNDRYQSAEDVLSALERARVPAPAGAPKPVRLNSREVGPRARPGMELKRVRLMDEAVAALTAGNKAKAQRLLLAFTELDPRSEHAWLLLADVAPRPRQTVAALLRALAINPGNGRARECLRGARLEAGLASLRDGNKREARQHLLRVVAEDWRNERAWLALGAAADLVQDTVTALEQVLAINPANPQARQWRAQHQGRQAGAGSPCRCPLCRSASAAVHGRCPSCQAVLSLGNLDAILDNHRADQKQMREAIAHYEAERRNRSEFASYYWLGLAYLNANRPGPGTRCLRVAAKLRPDYPVFRCVVRRLAKRVSVLRQRMPTNRRTRLTHRVAASE
jgi:tetratricopeptide (TPR) repeat protein